MIPVVNGTCIQGNFSAVVIDGARSCETVTGRGVVDSGGLSVVLDVETKCGGGDKNVKWIIIGVVVGFALVVAALAIVVYYLVRHGRLHCFRPVFRRQESTEVEL